LTKSDLRARGVFKARATGASAVVQVLENEVGGMAGRQLRKRQGGTEQFTDIGNGEGRQHINGRWNGVEKLDRK
jgi:hypothetical protein